MKNAQPSIRLQVNAGVLDGEFPESMGKWAKSMAHGLIESLSSEEASDKDKEALLWNLCGYSPSGFCSVSKEDWDTFSPTTPETITKEAKDNRYHLRRNDAACDKALNTFNDRSLENWLRSNLTVDFKPRHPGLQNTSPDFPIDPFGAAYLPFKSYRLLAQKVALQSLAFLPPSQNLLITLPTGGGKSSLFHLGIRHAWSHIARRDPSIAGVLSIVIVPLRALASDHIKEIEAQNKRICNAKKNAAQSEMLNDDEKRHLHLTKIEPLDQDTPGYLQRVRSPQGPTLFFCSPEKLLKDPELNKNLLQLAQENKVHSIYIDEAHIIASWGSSFRPDFQLVQAWIDKIRTQSSDIRTVLATATLDKESEAYFHRFYQSPGKTLQRVDAHLPRTEISIVGKRFEQQTDRDRCFEAILPYLPRPCIVYCGTQKETQELTEKLKNTHQYSRAEYMHGGTDQEAREELVDEWREGKLDIVVATSAFGMGINKSNVRCVVHLCLPETPSRYYQEIGRGGRDGYQTLALSLWTQKDEQLAHKLRHRTELTTKNAVNRWRAMSQPAGGNTVCLDPRRVPVHAETNLTNALHQRWNKTLLTQILLKEDDSIERNYILQDQAFQIELTFPDYHPLLSNQQEKLTTYFNQDRLYGNAEDEEDAQSHYLQHLLEIDDDCHTSHIVSEIDNFPDFDADPPVCGHCGPCDSKETYNFDARNLRAHSRHFQETGLRFKFNWKGSAVYQIRQIELNKNPFSSLDTWRKHVDNLRRNEVPNEMRHLSFCHIVPDNTIISRLIAPNSESIIWSYEDYLTAFYKTEIGFPMFPTPTLLYVPHGFDDATQIKWEKAKQLYQLLSRQPKVGHYALPFKLVTHYGSTQNDSIMQFTEVDQ